MGGKPGGSLWEKCNYAVGVEYGYSLPVGRRLNLDFVIGAGLLGRRIPYIRSRWRPVCLERDQAASLVRAHESGGLARVASGTWQL